jgi:hypothetical protein
VPKKPDPTKPKAKYTRRTTIPRGRQNPCQICISPNREAIEAAAMERAPHVVEREFAPDGPSDTAIWKHMRKCVPRLAAEIRDARERWRRQDEKRRLKLAQGAQAEYDAQQVVRQEVLGEQTVEQAKKDLTTYRKLEDLVNELLTRTKKLYDALDEYLTHPDDPERYILDAHASEIKIIWEELDEAYFTEHGRQKWTRKAGTLQEALALAFSNGHRRLYKNNPIKFADPRKLIDDVANTQIRTIDQIAKLQGWYRPVEKTFGEGDTVQLVVIQNLLVQHGLLPKG